MAKYDKEDKVLCKHGLCTYQAKILDVEQANGTFRYFVHYQGWNPKWDEWVPDDRVDTFTEEKAKAVFEQNKILTEQHKKKSRQSGSRSKGNLCWLGYLGLFCQVCVSIVRTLCTSLYLLIHLSLFISRYIYIQMKINQFI